MRVGQHAQEGEQKAGEADEHARPELPLHHDGINLGARQESKHNRSHAGEVAYPLGGREAERIASKSAD